MKRSSKDSQIKSKSRVFAEIDLGTIEKNFKAIRKKAGQDVDVLCVVKADAYGHGMTRVSRRLSECGCFFFGVSSVEEGVRLRRSGIEGKILILGGLLPSEDPAQVIEYQLTPVVHEIEGLKRLCEFTKNNKKKIGIHVKFDSGMGRLGFMPEDANYLLEIFKHERNLFVEGIMSHFSESEKRDSYGLKQIEIVKSIVKLFSSTGIKPRFVHMANTGALINYPESYFNMVRIGIGLYGSYPAKELEGSLPIEEALSLKSIVAFVKEFEAGVYLSYGRTYVTKRRTRIGFVPCGYSDGYRRGLSNLANVIVGGKMCPVVGRICMDWTLVDITDTEAKAGDLVILLGKERDVKITAWDLAEKLGTIPYEIFCGLSSSIKRYYI
ncbi:MAG: alanine racemase [Desulfobacterota bacterium]|nr:alanine racemase [Thermodesulfobacteriota bacterium]MDW8001110.1 alanine racemase [Deltaproteobacteria bacterium]